MERQLARRRATRGGITALALAIALAGCGGSTFAPAEGEGNFAGSFSSDGVDRTYVAHTPPNFAPSESLPLFVVLHGVPGTAQSIRAITDMDPLADELRFVVAYPDAAFREWTAGCECTRADLEGVDDVRFIGKLIGEMHGRLGIDRTRSYVVGFSQGALMTFKLACDLADRIAAAATVAATMLSTVTEACGPARPIPMLIVHGTADPEFPPQGRTGESTSTISIAATVEKWVDVNGCATTPVTTPISDTVDDGTTVSRNTYGSCRGQAIVEYLVVEGGGHTWPGAPVDFSPQLGLKSGDISASREITQLLVQFRSN